MKDNEQTRRIFSATQNGIREIRRLCDEAIDHEMGWSGFCEMVRHRLEIETEFVNISNKALKECE